MPTAIPRLNLHDQLVAGIRDLITNGAMRPGDKVSEAMLCERFDVSRTPLREALKVLASEGLVELRPRRGAIVASVSEDEIEEIFPIMASLEALAGEMACKKATVEEIAEMQLIHDKLMRDFKAKREDAYLAGNRAFHEGLFRIADNATLYGFYAQILTRIRTCRFVVRKSAQNWRAAVEDHEAMMDALAAKDGRRLSRLLRRHVMGVTVAIAHEAIETIRKEAEAEEKPGRQASKRLAG